MAVKRDWVDYTNLAANVVQTAQLDGINSKMRQMAELELQKEYREQQEVAVAKCEDLLRDAVFFYSEQLRDLEEIASQNPAAAYIRGSHLKRTYEDMPQFKSSGFRKFEDKERLANVQRTYDRFIRESASRMNSEELQKCKQCVEHIFDRDELLTLISVQDQAEDLERDRATLPEKQAAKQAELQKLNAEQQRNNASTIWTTRGSLAAMVAGVAFGGTALIIFIIGNYKLSETNSTSLDFVAGSILFGVLSGLSLLVMKGLKTAPCLLLHQELSKQIATVESDIGTMCQAVSKKEAEFKRHRALYTKFGTANPDAYRQMLSDRDTLLTQMLGDFAKDLTERNQPRRDVESKS